MQILKCEELQEQMYFSYYRECTTFILGQVCNRPWVERETDALSNYVRATR